MTRAFLTTDELDEHGFCKSRRDFIIQPGVAGNELRRVDCKSKLKPHRGFILRVEMEFNPIQG